MLVTNYTEFRNGLKNYLDDVEQNDETLIIKRSSNKGTVLISLEEYNSIIETAHLLSSRANKEHLDKSIAQMNSGETLVAKLIEE